MQILSLIQDRFVQALVGLVDDPPAFAAHVAVARDARHGDYQANLAMPLAKLLGKNPREIAEELIQKVSIDDLCATPEIAGPGFINLRLKKEFLGLQLQQLVGDERIGVRNSTEPRTYVIDYSSPNVAKPMHVGHIRTTVIGDALARILRFLGHKVISDNHLGDWGTQFGMIIYGYKHFADSEQYQQQPVAELSRIYRVVQAVIGYQASLPKLTEAEEKLQTSRAERDRIKQHPDEDAKKQKKLMKAAERAVRSAEESLSSLQKKVAAVSQSKELTEIAEAHENLEHKAQLETAKLHEGDPENLGLWNQFMPISIQEIDAIYQRLDIQFDHTYGESFYQPMLADVVDELVQQGLAEENDGAMCMFLEGFDAPMIIRKRDGAFLYATTDLATIRYRMEHFQPDAILYVVDHRQSEHFEKLFVAARKMGYDQVELQHISFGTVLGPDGKPFKTRSGSVLGLEYLLDEAIEKAFSVVCNPERQLSEEEQREIATTVGLGAIKYADLSHNRTSDYKFDLDAMVQLEGDTGAYLQYMYARTKSISRKAEEILDPSSAAATKILMDHDAERALVLLLIQFEDALLQSMEEYYPSILVGYLLKVAKQFATFFDQCPVLKADEELRASRLVICFATSQVLKQGLALLGIGVVERM